MHNDKKAYQVDRTPTELLSDLLVQLKFLRQECLPLRCRRLVLRCADCDQAPGFCFTRQNILIPCWPKLQSVLHSAVRIFSV